MHQQGFAAAVKRIVDVKVAKNGTKYFRICWKDTWEAEAHLLSCQTLLDDFLEKKNSQATESTLASSIQGQQIQCDLINTTTSSKSTSPDEKTIQINDNLKGKSLSSLSSTATTVKLTNTFSSQYHSCCSHNNTEKISKVDSILQCSLCRCDDVEEIITTRDVGCQCEPDVRHFAVQKEESKEERPEVAEVSVQVEPSVSCTSTQYFDPSKSNLRYREAVRVTPSNVSKQQQQQQQQTSFTQADSASNQDEELVSNKRVAITDDDSICIHPNLIELDYSQIPSDVLQQILQNTTSGMQVQQQKVAEDESDQNNQLKPMFFVVDGGTEQLFEQGKPDVLPQHKGTIKTVDPLTKSKSTRGRKRKAELDTRPEKISKQQLSKAILSRNLFQLDNVNSPSEIRPIAPNISTTHSINQHLVIAPKVSNPDGCHTVRSPVGSTLNSPETLPQNLNESNVSVVSTVYDPFTSPLHAGVQTHLIQQHTIESFQKTSAPEKQLSSFTKEEEKINEDFISKYWK